MGITKKQLLAQCRSDTLQASGADAGRADGERTHRRRMRNTGALGVEVAPQLHSSIVLALPPSANTYGATGQTACTRQPGGAGLQGGRRQVEGVCTRAWRRWAAALWTSTCTVKSQGYLDQSSPRC